MKCLIDKLWVNDPRKKLTKAGKFFWTFYTSLGKWSKGYKKGDKKGTLNLMYFGNEKLYNQMLLENAAIDLFCELVEGRYYFKAILLGWEKSGGKIVSEEPMVNVNDEFPIPSTEELATQIIPVETKIPKQTQGLDPEIEKLVYNYDNGKEIK